MRRRNPKVWLVGQSLHCSNSPNPARAEEFKDLEPSSRLSFVPHPNIPPPDPAGLSQLPILGLPLLGHPHSIRNGLLEPGAVTALREGEPKPGITPGAGSGNAGQKPCDSFSLNYNNLYQGQLHLCLFFLNTQQGVMGLSHLPTLSSHLLRGNIPKSRQNRH